MSWWKQPNSSSSAPSKSEIAKKKVQNLPFPALQAALGFFSLVSAIFNAWVFISSHRTPTAKIQRKGIIEQAREYRKCKGRPPSILVVGFPCHGKSSFINTVFRVMYEETGPLIRRAETGPPMCNHPVTSRFKIFPLKSKEVDEIMFNLIDSPALDPAMDRNHIEAAFSSIVDDSFFTTKDSSKFSMSPDCIIIVLSIVEICWDNKHSYELALSTAATTMRAKGIPFMIVVTKRDLVPIAHEALDSVLKSVASWCCTDSVYALKNYWQCAPGNDRVTNMGNDKETDKTALQIVRQALEFVK